MHAATPSRLTAGEAEALWRAWSTKRDARARDRLAMSYTPMVRYLATKKVRELPTHCDLDDLVSCGLLALVESIDRFDPAKGATFEQYAWTRVSGAILDELRRQDWAPRSLRRMARKIDGAEEALHAKNGTAPAQEQVASAVGIEIAELRRVLEELGRAEIGSLNAPARVADESIAVEIGDTIGDDEEATPEHAFLARERANTLRKAIASLDEREQQVLALVHVHSVPGAEIGRMLGVTESRVSQILSGVRATLKRSLNEYDAAAIAAA
jgi:RNA polymerase sigma factor for flagellar operon FliA